MPLSFDKISKAAERVSRYYTDSNLLYADYSMKHAVVCRDDVSSTPSPTTSESPACSPICFSTRQSPHSSLRPPVPQHHLHHQQFMSLSPDHGVTPSSQVVTPPLQPAVAATTASPTPASRTTSPELLDIPAEPRRRAGSRSKGKIKSSHEVLVPCVYFRISYGGK